MDLLVIPYPNIDPVALKLGPLSIKWYGLAYVAGLLLGWQYIRHLLATDRYWGASRPPVPPDAADDLFVWVALGVIVGGRLGHVLLYEPVHYLTNPLEIPQVWKGGMAFHGGLIGTIAAMYLFARARKVAALSIMDLVAAAVPIGLFFGRIANFINAEVVGTPSNVPWAMVFPDWGEAPRHPAQLYEAALEGLVLFLILRFLIARRTALASPGTVGGAFLLGYGAFRIVCEMFKHDEYRRLLGDLPLTSGMAYSLPMLAFGIWLLVRARPADRST